MATFAFTARDKRGQTHKGNVEAASKHEALAKLRRKQWTAVAIKQLAGKADSDEEEITPILGSFVYRDSSGAIQLSVGQSKPTTRDLIIFTKQFSTMLNSGVPLIQALLILTKQQSNSIFRKVLRQVAVSVENGSSISQALTQHPQIFDTLYVAMTEAGEVSGKLDAILLRLVGFLEKSNKIKNQVKSAMSYPVIIAVVAISVVVGLLAFVVPTFAAQYAETGRTLPGLTQAVIDASNHLMSYLWLYALLIVGAVLTLLWWIKTPRGKKLFDRWILRAPVLGVLLQKVAVGRFCSTLATMLSSGVNLLTALSICATSSGNTTIEDFIVGVRASLEKGSTLSAPLGEGKLFPQMVVAMIAVGEATGNLDEMLEKVSEFYDEEVDVAVKGLLSMIEPIMIIVIGLLVGFIVIAMYLPVFEMAG